MKNCLPLVGVTNNCTIDNTSSSGINSSIQARTSRLSRRSRCRSRLVLQPQDCRISNKTKPRMSMKPQQSFANHTRWHPPFHFFILPVMLINFIWSVVDLIMTPGWNSGRWAVVSLALLMLTFFVRTNPLKVQDRLIRLEEQLRCQRLLSPALSQQISGLSSHQLIALRFAADEELEELVDAVAAGKLTKPVEIKKAIRSWRSDRFRV